MTSPAFTIRLDLADLGAARQVGRWAAALGGEVLAGPGKIVPELLVVDPSRLDTLPLAVPPESVHPAVLLYAAASRLVPRALLRREIFALVEPGDGEEGFSQAAAEALEEVRKRQADLTGRRELENRYRDLSTIIRLNLEVGMELSVDRVLERIVAQIAEDLDFGIVSVMLLAEDGKVMTICASRGLSAKICESARVEVGKGISGWVAQTGQPLLIKDIENHPKFRKLKSHGRYSSMSLICVPLKVRERVIGVLNGNNRGDGQALTVHDLRLLSVFAAQASVSIERARLYQNLEEKAKELAAAYQRLQEIDRMKSDFITNVSHEFRTPLTIILGYLDILKGQLAQQGQARMVEITLGEAHRLARLMEDITDMLRLDTGAMTFEINPVIPEDFLRECVRTHLASFRERSVNLTLETAPGLPPIPMDAVKMTKVMEKLLDNSLKFTPPGGYTKVRAVPWQEAGVLVMVEDSGSGIPIGSRERVFLRFEQGGDIMTEKPKGAGLGLPIARAIVKNHGGDLWLDESFTTGCRILFTLPGTR